jgi:hypothetical protein
MKDDLRDDIAKAIADTIGHGMREKCLKHADAALAVIDADSIERAKPYPLANFVRAAAQQPTQPTGE